MRENATGEEVFYFDDNFSLTAAYKDNCLWLDLTFENEDIYKFTEISKEKAQALINFLQTVIKEI